jgi:ribosomal-protein-alanine N-acetyltransferase
MAAHPALQHPPELTTERLLLRTWAPEDAPRVRELVDDEDVARYVLSFPYPYVEGTAEDWIARRLEQAQAGTGVAYAVTERGTGLLIGSVALHLEARHRRGELGYWFGKDYWGRGYCPEAVREVLDCAFQVLGLHKVTASHAAPNVASGRVLEKVGMAREGYLREHVQKDERYADVVLYGLLREEWERAAGSWAR